MKRKRRKRRQKESRRNPEIEREKKARRRAREIREGGQEDHWGKRRVKIHLYEESDLKRSVHAIPRLAFFARKMKRG